MKSEQKGFIKWLLLAIVALALLKFFLNWDIFDAAASEQGRSTIGYLRDLFNTIWSYIAAPVTFVWSQILWPLLEMIWLNFQAFLEWGRETAEGGDTVNFFPINYGN